MLPKKGRERRAFLRTGQPLLTRFIHELFEILANMLKYKSKFNNLGKQSVFCTGWKACATRFFAVWRIILAKIVMASPGS
jgi:hypothetical protein